MNQKKTKLTLLFLVGIGLSGLHAQEASVSSGGDASGAGGSAAYSVGQVAYTSITSGSGSVNQGVQQPYVILITGLDNNPTIDLSVYPNPSVAFINLNVGNQNLENLSFELFDVQGKLLVSQKITAKETAIKMDEYSAANYFLKVIDNNKEVKTFKIIKN